MRFAPVAASMTAAFVTAAALAADGSCFIKAGDRVGFFGDSITDAGAYVRLTELVFMHFHPDADVGFINNGHSGLTLAGTKIDRVVAGEPTVVAIMIGMNDAINSAWVRGMPVEPAVARYKASLVNLVRELKAKDIAVVILTPTLTDETCAATCFRTEGTRLLLTAMGVACEEVAGEESVVCVPVQSEFERYEETLHRFASLRPDGVHPCARGHYQIARSLWAHLNLAGTLDGTRRLSPVPVLADVTINLATNIRAVDSNVLEFAIETAAPAPAKVTWSLGQLRGAEELNLTGKDTWLLKLPEGALPQADGKSATLVLDVESQGGRSVFVVDVFRKRVIHGKDGEAAAVITDEQGTALCTYRFRKEGRALVFEAEVKKGELFQGSEDQWPWGNGDALTLYLDLGDGAKLGGLGFDGDVYQVWFKPQDKPFFSPGFHPWSGKHMTNVATAYGERLHDGYKVGLQLAGYRNIRERFDISDRDFIGFDLSLIYAEALGKRKWLNVQESDRRNFLFPGTFMLVDLYGKLTDDSAYSVSVFPDKLRQR